MAPVLAAPPSSFPGRLIPGYLHILFLATFLVAYNNAAAFIPDGIRDAIYVPMNLSALCLLLLWAVKGLHLSSNALGLGRSRAIRAGALGLIVGLAIPAPLFIPALLPDVVSRGAANLGMSDMPMWQLLYQTVVRIPLGTALWEEMAFRSVLYGQWRKAHGDIAALVGSSAVFGLWHVAPTYQSVTGAQVLGSDLLLAGAIAGAVVVTFLGGLMFGLLRIYSRSIVGCVVVHSLINSLTTVAFFLRAS